MTVRRLALACLLLGLEVAGCAPRAAYPPPPTQPPQQPPGQQPQPPQPGTTPEPQPEPAPPRSAQQASSAAVIALLDRAKQQSSSGDYGLAAASLERALDVEPRNPFVYHRLATLRLQQGQAGQAEALARKSNSLAVDNPYVQARNWELIAKSRSIRGDSVGASAASSRADYYQRQADTGQ